MSSAGSEAATSRLSCVSLRRRPRNGGASSSTIAPAAAACRRARSKPLGLVVKAGIWYVVGRANDEMRIYRASRIGALYVTPESFAPPREFDLASFWARARDEFKLSRPRIEVTVRLKRSALPALRETVDWTVWPAVDRAFGVAGGGALLELVLPFERVDYAYADLVKLGGAVEVVAPPELRDRLAAAGRSLMGTYRPGGC